MKSPLKQRLTATGAGPWQVTSYKQRPFNVGFGVIPNSSATINVTVQHTFDNPNDDSQGCVLTRAGTTATVVMANHGLSTNDCAVISHSGSSNLDGQQTVTVVDINTFTYTVANSGPTVGGSDTRCAPVRVFPHAFVAAATARTDGNYAYPPMAVRLLVSTLTGTGAFVDFYVIQGNDHG